MLGLFREGLASVLKMAVVLSLSMVISRERANHIHYSVIGT